MKEVSDGQIQATVTSPPYWNLKNYNHHEQIGLGEKYEKYHERLNKVWKECFRTLSDDGTLWIVVDKISFKGELLNIPFDIVKNCRKLGFNLKDIIVWNKPTAIAGMNPRNLVNKYETIIFLSKSQDKVKLRNLPNGSNTPDVTIDKKKLTNLWRFPVKAGSIRKTPAHEAPYPEELIIRIVNISTDKGDLVLDPFLGSGTTLKVALEMGRTCIGYEINEDFSDIMAERLNVQRLMTSWAWRK
jgi:site-specific DNA-methyltransferase (adenine-specific)